MHYYMNTYHTKRASYKTYCAANFSPSIVLNIGKEPSRLWYMNISRFHLDYNGDWYKIAAHIFFPKIVSDGLELIGHCHMLTVIELSSYWVDSYYITSSFFLVVKQHV